MTQEKGQLSMRVSFVTFGKERSTHGLMDLKHSTFLANLNLTSIQGELWLRIKTKNLYKNYRLFKGFFHLLEVCGQENPSLQAGKGGLSPGIRRGKVRVLKLH